MATLGLAVGDGFPVIMQGAGLTSCRPLLSLLQEEDAKLKFFALQKMVLGPLLLHRPPSLRAPACTHLGGAASCQESAEKKWREPELFNLQRTIVLCCSYNTYFPCTRSCEILMLGSGAGIAGGYQLGGNCRPH